MPNRLDGWYIWYTMRRLRCLAIVLALLDLLLVGSVVQAVVLARETMPPCHAAPVGNSDTISYISSPKTASVSDDSYVAQRWGVGRIEAHQAWQIAQGGSPVVVAVLDTGIDEDSQDLVGRVVAEVNFADSPTSGDLYGHGTHMAGTIAAIAPECQLMNVKVADDLGRCQASVVARGIVWAVDHGAEVINVSLCVESSADLEEAVNYAWSRGALIVAAAGNLGEAAPAYPAYYVNCLAVAGIDESDSIALLSNYGDWVDVAAPGFNIYSELPDDQYGYKSGTSSAVAHVSGVAALVFTVAEDSNGNGLVSDEVREAIENSCSPLGADGVGKGCVNALEAVTAATAAPVTEIIIYLN
jgi:thermitase